MHGSIVKNRLIINSTIILLIALLSITTLFTAFIHFYYYKSLQNLLDGKSDGVSSYFSVSSYTQMDFTTKAVDYVNNFKSKNNMQIAIYDNNGELIASSFEDAQIGNYKTPDYQIAQDSENGYGMYTGNIDSGEKIMSITQVVKNSNKEILGSVSYLLPLNQVDSQITRFLACIFCLGLLSIIFITFINYKFVKSLIKPLDEIISTTKLIARGDFKARIKQRKKKTDITELCKTINYMAEELETNEKIKNDFISSISHELRTPLTAIRGWAETMKTSNLTDAKTIDKGMQVIIHETSRLSAIVEELLDFSHIQKQDLNLRMEKLDLLAELDEAVYVYKEKAALERKHLVFDAPVMLPPVLADSNRMKQVFINIIDNAIKYSEESDTIKIIAKEQDGNVVISISDEGAGISAKDLPRVKEKFFKANTTKRGSGIGLAVANEIMLAHNGKLDIESEEGVGTTVYIVLPTLKNDSEKDKLEKE